MSTFPPFPELPAVVAEYTAARTTDINSLSNPAPWDLGALTAEVLDPVLAWLDAVCRWLNQTYAWQPHQVIPPCWQQHEHVAYEIAAFASTRIDTATDPGTAIIWHEQYDRFTTRMNNTLGKAGDDCRVGRHEPRPARFALSVWPPENRAGGPT
ncbi:hypothetical protein ACSCBZ_41440 [Streptomyces niveiscabiei]|uniref:hypothetical protein n=1 Tax=Streptomyces niveiscabiei TaxID=164115 RepID=UPI0006EB77C5|nr:hypothetical protein [Streptomyces niveiscabiei]